MDTVFLAQFMGLFSLVIGSGMLIKRKMTVKIFDEMFGSRALIYLVGIAEIVGGVLLVLFHNVWDSPLASVVSALAWILLIEGVFYMFASQRALRNTASLFHKQSAYYMIGVAYFLVGAVLVLSTFWV
ncbi:MAG: hypothetical protein Q8P86_02070 [bacterium]|nr:hypothetical protein [bacterium]